MKKLKCEACGGSLKVDETGKYAVCEYCRSEYKMEEDIKANHNIKINEKNNMIYEINKFSKSFIIIVFFIIIFGVIGSIILISNMNINFNKVEDTTNLVKDIQNSMHNKDNELIKQKEEITQKQKENVERISFNNFYENILGNQYGLFIQSKLNEIIKNNNNNGEHIIKVTYNDISSSESQEINKIHAKLENNEKYYVELKYDDNNYVNELIIKDM